MVGAGWEISPQPVVSSYAGVADTRQALLAQYPC